MRHPRARDARSRRVPCWLILTHMLALSACWVGDGRLVVRGRVLELAPQPRPIPGARVTVGEATANDRTGRSQGDGSYVATYKFGGMFPFDTNSRAPRVSVAAPGYAPVCYDLGRRDDTAQVKRSDCAPASSDCFQLDFYLAPEGGADSR